MRLREFKNVELVAKQHSIILLYCGPFSEAMLQALGDALREKMSNEEADMTHMGSVFSIFVEQAQNVIRYSTCHCASDDDPSRLGLIAIGSEEDRYYIVCQNEVHRDNMERIRSSLDEIRTLDKPEIKRLFRQRLREDPGEHSLGAGLGFLEIARRSSEPVEYSFEDSGGDCVLFTLKAFV